ncbi:MAG: hypothetical protein C9356_15285 [Oleiphilus sp.]|nr:MAG: hypothetical protein C9356_15285 [Oleiphilus sp.]
MQGFYKNDADRIRDIFVSRTIAAGVIFRDDKGGMRMRKLSAYEHALHAEDRAEATTRLIIDKLLREPLT